MKYSLAVLALAASVVSAWSNDTVVYTTEIVDVYTTVCPVSGAVTYNGQTYTNTMTEESTITITNCPCTVVKPIIKTSAVLYSPCPEGTGTAPAPVKTLVPIGTGSYSTGGIVKPTYTYAPVSGASINQIGGFAVAAIAGAVALAL